VPFALPCGVFCCGPPTNIDVYAALFLTSSSVQTVVLRVTVHTREPSTIGLDIAKSVFQIHGVDVDGAVVIRKRISRAKLLEFFASLPACLVGIEACPTRGAQAGTD
jgi:hypothetical protein